MQWIKTHKLLVTIFAATAAIAITTTVLATCLNITPQAQVGDSTDNNSNIEYATTSLDITFTSDKSTEEPEKGIFYLEKRKIEELVSEDYIATGKSTTGRKATGNLYIEVFFLLDSPGTKTVNRGATFTLNGYTFTADDEYSISWDGDIEKCANRDLSSFNPKNKKQKCQRGMYVFITAVETGKQYNNVHYRYANMKWTTSADLGPYYTISVGLIGGGTDGEDVIVTQQSDIDSATAKLERISDSELKRKLYSTIQEKYDYIIDSSFSTAHSEPIPNAPIGSAVKDGTVSATDSASVFVVSRAKLIDYAKASILDGDQDEASIEENSLAIEDFTEDTSPIAATLKLTYLKKSL